MPLTSTLILSSTLCNVSVIGVLSQNTTFCSSMRRQALSLDLIRNPDPTSTLIFNVLSFKLEAYSVPLPSPPRSGDQWLTIEWRDASGVGTWHSSPEQLLSESASLPSLLSPPHHAVVARVFRLVAHNEAGRSESGPRSEPMLPYHHFSSAVRPPVLSATSSSSFLLLPPLGRTDSCGVDQGLRFEVLMRREGSDRWQTLTQIAPQVRPALCHVLCPHNCVLCGETHSVLK